MKRLRVGGLIQNAAALIISSAVSAIIGLVFWVAAAHLTSTTNLGRSSAEIAAVALLTQLSGLSYGATFERFIPVAGARTRQFVARGYATCAALALVISMGYVFSGLGHNFIRSGFVWRGLFVISVVGWTVFVLQDSVLVGLRSARWVPVENILYSLTKLAVLPVFIVWSASQGIFLAWMFPVVWLIIAVNWYLFKRRIPEHQERNESSEKLPSMRQLFSLSGARYAGLLVSVMTTSITTLVVIDRLGAVANAHYYIPAQISMGATLALSGIMRSFIVETSSDPGAIRRFARITLRTTVALLSPVIVIGVVFAPQILGLFGGSYATQGATLLRMLLLSVPAVAITSFYAAFAWIDRRVWWLAIREVASAIIFFGVMLALLGHLGIVAVGIASLVESAAQAFFFLPILIRRYRAAINDPSSKGGRVSTIVPEE